MLRPSPAIPSRERPRAKRNEFNVERTARKKKLRFRQKRIQLPLVPNRRGRSVPRMHNRFIRQVHQLIAQR
jgi:hypothetical protein